MRDAHLDDDSTVKYRKSKRTRGAKCVGRVKWPWRSEPSPCWHRVERGQTLCVHHRSSTPSRWYLRGDVDAE